MSYSMDYVHDRIAAEASQDVRAAFIRRTYGHLAGAILLFVAVEALLLQVVPPQLILGMFSTGISWLVVMVAFMVVSWLANAWAQSASSPGLQYLGLGLYVLAEAVIFLPLLYIAAHYFSSDVIPNAGILTLAIFLGLTVVAFATRHDFSWLGAILGIGCFVALGVIVASIWIGFSLGLFFVAAMVILACGFILYSTSNVLHRYRTDQHVAAALALFASVALLFWYILQLVMSRDR